MKSTPYKIVRDGVLTRMGIDASLTPLTSQSAALAEYLQSALDSMWEFYPWPDVTLTEQRTPALHTIDAEQPGETVIGDFLEIYDNNPDDDSQLSNNLPFTLTGSAAVLSSDWHVPNTPVWVRFRIPTPVFTSADYSAATAYAPGDVVYHDPTGDCYLCTAATTGNAPTNSSFWRRQLIPAYLGEAAKLHALAETQQEDGQYDKANFLFARSRGLLEEKQDDFWMKRDRYHHFTARFQ